MRANAILPSVIDTPGNRASMPDADFDRWVKPAEIAGVVAHLLSARQRAGQRSGDPGLRPGLTGEVGAMERKWWTLVVVCVATFMLLLDITIVNVALPKIAADLHSSFSDIQWVIDAYALTLAALLLTAGALADLLGRKLVFAIGLGLFSVTSLLCGLAPSSMFLILARGGQGIGGAIMFSTSLALLAQEFHGRERGTAFGAWGATIAASAAVGPLLGGALTQAFGWSSIFFINVPVGLAACGLTLAKVNESRNPRGHAGRTGSAP